MDVKRTQNVSFTGKVVLSAQKQKYAENQILRPLIKHLKHHCGGNDVSHRIDVSNIHLSITSGYKPKNNANIYLRTEIVSDNPITKENIKKLIKDTSENNIAIQKLKEIVKRQEPTIAIIPPKEKSIFQKFLSIFRK